MTLKFLSYHTFPPLFWYKKQKTQTYKSYTESRVYCITGIPYSYHIPKIMRLLWHARYGSNGTIWPEPGVTLGQPCQSSQIAAAGGNPKKKKEFTTALLQRHPFLNFSFDSSQKVEYFLVVVEIPGLPTLAAAPLFDRLAWGWQWHIRSVSSMELVQ